MRFLAVVLALSACGPSPIDLSDGCNSLDDCREKAAALASIITNYASGKGGIYAGDVEGVKMMDKEARYMEMICREGGTPDECQRMRTLGAELIPVLAACEILLKNDGADPEGCTNPDMR